MKVFLDTNVIISAVATRGLCSDLFRLIVTEHELVIAEVVIAEATRVLRDRFGVPADRIAEFEEFLRSNEVVPKPKTKAAIELRDDSDRWILASAAAANVDVMITGDADILSVRDKFDVEIVTPREFWTTLRRG